MNKIFPICIIVLSGAILSGCLYPGSKINQKPHEKQLLEVQEAVDEFRQDNDNLLPIKNKDQETDKYIKYLIDLKLFLLFTEDLKTLLKTVWTYQ